MCVDGTVSGAPKGNDAPLESQRGFLRSYGHPGEPDDSVLVAG